MTTAVMDAPQQETSPATSVHEKSVREMIAAARKAPAGPFGAWVLSLATGLLMWAAFTPLDWGPLGWVCLIPLLQLVRIPRPTGWMYTVLALNGTLFALATLQWMRLGDATMYPAWMALSVYVGLYFPAFVFLSRAAVHRFDIPILIATPVVWVGLEFLRAHLMTGFAWYYLAHSQHGWVTLIQICDLFGTYGLSFLLVMANTALAGLVPVRWLQALRLFPDHQPPTRGMLAAPFTRRLAAVTIPCLLLVASLVYGAVRRSQVEFEAGPRMALIQGNYPATVKSDPKEWADIYRTHMYLTGASIEHQPDVIVWPETMFRYPLLLADPEMTDAQLRAVSPFIPPERWRENDVEETVFDLAEQCNAALILGIDAHVTNPDRYAHYNSALLVEPGTGVRARYDKLHRVPFGEYIPLRESLPFLQKFTPYGDQFGLAAGEKIHVFNVESWRMVPLICYEDTVPHLVRNMVARTRDDDGRSVDCLVNLTNDGWFHGSSELDQHLITAAFRCVETRTPMVRAVNTGISAFIDGDGVVREPDVFVDGDALLEPEKSGPPRNGIRDPESGSYHRQLNAVLVSDVALDPRESLYVVWGDWFAAVCLAACLGILLLTPVSMYRARTSRG
ncbi:apolipoprotein N-acyltransferase [Maioricimonas sp. JC845]|uniref:apolipoprotein N-acyltransferase n=1 Tax=Maioricimonas sp. JC845 TaxID=3232138 RepID=UPI00345A78AC